MARLKFDALAHYPFCTELQIYTSHINHGNHLDNAQLLTLVSEARLRFIRWLGYDEMDVLGLGTVVGDVGAQYLSEGFHGDVLQIEMAPADLPDDVLIYTLPSRYCLPDVLGAEAWKLFGSLPPGYGRVSAICAYVHQHLTFSYGT